MNLPNDLPAFDPWSRRGSIARLMGQTMRLGVWIALAIAGAGLFLLTGETLSIIGWAVLAFGVIGGVDAYARSRSATRALRNVSAVRAGATATQHEEDQLDATARRAGTITCAAQAVLMASSFIGLFILMFGRPSAIFTVEAALWIGGTVAALLMTEMLRVNRQRVGVRGAAGTKAAGS